jgi:hypothetical protein
MSAVHDPTRVLSAQLEPDGTIRLCLLFPDSVQPYAATIEPIESTIRAAGHETRQIDLMFGAESDRQLRLIVAMHADALAYEHEREQHGAPPAPPAAPEVNMETRTDPTPAFDDWAEAVKLATEMDAAKTTKTDYRRASARASMCVKIIGIGPTGTSISEGPS